MCWNTLAGRRHVSPADRSLPAEFLAIIFRKWTLFHFLSTYVGIGAQFHVCVVSRSNCCFRIPVSQSTQKLNSVIGICRHGGTLLIDFYRASENLCSPKPFKLNELSPEIISAGWRGLNLCPLPSSNRLKSTVRCLAATCHWLACNPLHRSCMYVPYYRHSRSLFFYP